MLYLSLLACGLSFAARGNALLGSAASFGALAGSALTSTGNSKITGDMGVYPGTAITGFPPGNVTGATHNADDVAQQAQADAATAFNNLAAMAPTKSLSGQDLGGMTLTSGVYNFASSGQLTGTLTLDAEGNSNAEFVFQFGSTITTAVSSEVVIINSGKACNVYWQVGSSATIGTTTTFLGNILASSAITLNHGVNIQGGIYALNAAITLDTDNVTAQGDCSGTVTPRAAPETSTSVATSTISTLVTITVTKSTMTTSTKPSKSAWKRDGYGNGGETLTHQSNTQSTTEATTPSYEEASKRRWQRRN
jgi:hypothetical protein